MWELCRSGSLHDVMERVIKIRNLLSVRALHHLQVGEDLEVEAQYGEGTYFDTDRWFNHENWLKCLDKLLHSISRGCVSGFK